MTIRDLRAARLLLLGDSCKESYMLKTATAPDANAAGMRDAARIFTDEFVAVALFSGIGLLVALAAAFFGEQGVWI
jgi:hypothetical protein